MATEVGEFGEDYGLDLAYLKRFTQPFHTPVQEQALLADLAEQVPTRVKVGFVIGRFQPPHAGHVYLMRQALVIAETIIVGVGSANVRNQDNPFPPDVREQLLRGAIDEAGLGNRVQSIVRVNDYLDDQLWLEEALRKTGEVDVVVGNNGWVNGIFEQANIPAIEVPLLERGAYQGSVIRQHLRERGLLD